MIVVSGTAAIVLMILGVILWIVDSTNKARRLAAQRAKNRELRAQAAAPMQPQAPTAAPYQNPDPRSLPEGTGTQPPSMPYGM